jgi:hypothetical protein
MATNIAPRPRRRLDPDQSKVTQPPAMQQDARGCATDSRSAGSRLDVDQYLLADTA